MNSSQDKSAPPSVSLLEAFVPVLALIALLVTSVWLFGDSASGGPNQIALILASFVGVLMAMGRGVSWKTLENAILENINVAMQAILILLLIGALIGAWVLGGVVPTLVVWGLKLISPSLFLFSACIVCSIVSLASGSSWSTAGTVGVAFIGMGKAMGLPMGPVAGAVICGAYFGDKMSPLSETTNLAPSVAGTDLFVHIRHMAWTTVPAMIVTLLFFLIYGFMLPAENFSAERIARVTLAVNQRFDTSPAMLLPPIIVLVMVVRKVPVIPTLLTGCLLGVFCGVVFQSPAVENLAGAAVGAGAGGDPYVESSIRAAFLSASSGFTAKDATKEMADLLNRGGMASMLSTVWLILSAMFFGGVLQGAGMLQRIAAAVLFMARTTGLLIHATIKSCFFVNLTASDQYLSLVITGRMYREAYEARELDARNLSRALEDGGTLTSPLIPWNTCGAFMSSALGVATLTYAPWCLLNWLTPIVSTVYGYTGWTIVHASESQSSASADHLHQTQK